MIPISKPQIGKEEIRAVVKVLKSGQLAQGEKVEEFEGRFADYIGTKYAVAVSSGTAALHLSLLALGIKKGDEVITSAFSFIASANCIRYVGATPVFVDIDPLIYNIDSSKIEKAITSRTKAIIPIHLYGCPTDMDEIMHIAKKYKLAVVEDACQAHGASTLGRKVGSIGDIGCFSFYATKNMTTGEGGMITTNKRRLADKLRMLRNHGMRKRYSYEILGYNLRMTDIQAAIGIEQLRKLDKFNAIRKDNAHYLFELLKGSRLEIGLPGFRPFDEHIYHQYTISVPSDIRDKLKERLEKAGFQVGIYYPEPLASFFPVAWKASQRVLSIPIHPGVKKCDLERMAEIILSI